MTSSEFETEEMRPIEARCDEQFLYVTLADGRLIRAPLWWYPFLQQARPADRAKIELQFSGVWWQVMDEGVSVKALLLGWKAPGASISKTSGVSGRAMHLLRHSSNRPAGCRLRWGTDDMKFTLSWLKDHLETDASLDEIVERLTPIGLEVEAVDDKAGAEAVRHRPGADGREASRRRQAQGADGRYRRRAAAGAGGLRRAQCARRAGRRLRRARHLYSGHRRHARVGNIRGVESRGMMCSERELRAVRRARRHHRSACGRAGRHQLRRLCHLDDPVIDINLTPNRPDATGVHGIARDLAAAGLGTLKPGAVEPVAGRRPDARSR